MRYIIIDTMNMFFRCKHVAAKGTDAWTKVGYAMHLTLTSAAREYREHKGTHVVWALEGRHSWRKDFYPAYKKHRSDARAALDDEQIEEDKLFFDAYDDLTEFLDKRTNCTVLQTPGVEGDDIIARWVQMHPNDEHVIISSDTDFIQMIAPNCSQYNAMAKKYFSVDGVFDDKFKPLVDKKTKEVMLAPDPQWELFLKCIRGDKTDNIFSACPGAREKGSKNKVGIREAYEDSDTQGYSWNNFMLQRWVDHKQEEHKVLTDYERNRTLVDLTKQPEEIKDAMDLTIATAYLKPPAKMVGGHLMKLCGKYELNKVAEFVERYTDFLNARLPEIED